MTAYFTGQFSSCWKIAGKLQFEVSTLFKRAIFSLCVRGFFGGAWLPQAKKTQKRAPVRACLTNFTRETAKKNPRKGKMLNISQNPCGSSDPWKSQRFFSCSANPLPATTVATRNRAFLRGPDPKVHPCGFYLLLCTSTTTLLLGCTIQPLCCTFFVVAAYVAGPYGPLPPALGGHLAVVRL